MIFRRLKLSKLFDQNRWIWRTRCKNCGHNILPVELLLGSFVRSTQGTLSRLR